MQIDPQSSGVFSVRFVPQSYGVVNGRITVHSTDLEDRSASFNVEGDAGQRPFVDIAGFGFKESVYTKVSASEGGLVALALIRAAIESARTGRQAKLEV